MSNIAEIKAKLYDLQYHNCDGRVSVPRDPGDHGCSLCQRVLELRAELNAKLDQFIELIRRT